MIDWLRKDMTDPAVEISGRTLPIAIRRHARARRLTMRLAPDGSELRITLPTWCGTRDALAFAHARGEWIAAQLAKIPQTVPVEPDARIPYRGVERWISWDPKRPRKPVLDGAEIHLGGPRETLEARLQRWFESEALQLAREDLAFYCTRAGVAPPDLRLSRARRRWGSCSSSKGGGQCIRINWRLAMAPDPVRRSVVAHEVAHLTYFDHSPAFHAHLRDVFEGDLARADSWLRQEGRSLYASFA